MRKRMLPKAKGVAREGEVPQACRRRGREDSPMLQAAMRSRLPKVSGGEGGEALIPVRRQATRREEAPSLWDRKNDKGSPRRRDKEWLRHMTAGGTASRLMFSCGFPKRLFSHQSTDHVCCQHTFNFHSLPRLPNIFITLCPPIDYHSRAIQS